MSNRWVRGEKGVRFLALAKKRVEKADQTIRAIGTPDGKIVQELIRQEIRARNALSEFELNSQKRGSNTEEFRAELIQKNIDLRLAQYISKEIQRSHDLLLLNTRIRPGKNPREIEAQSIRLSEANRETVTRDVAEMMENRNDYLFSKAQEQVHLKKKSEDREKFIQERKTGVEIGTLGDNDEIVPLTPSQQKEELAREQRERQLYSPPVKREAPKGTPMPFRNFGQTKEPDYSEQINAISAKLNAYGSAPSSSHSFFRRSRGKSIDTRIIEIKELIEDNPRKNADFIERLEKRVNELVNAIPEKRNKSQKQADEFIRELLDDVRSIKSSPAPRKGS